MTADVSAPNGTGIPHLSSIGNMIGTDEAYLFYYTTNPVTLADPFGAGNTYPNITELTNVKDQISFQRQFGYDASGELTAFGLPNGGLLQWTYTQNKYSWSSPSTNNLALMAVLDRNLAVGAGASTSWFGSGQTPTEWAYSFGYTAPVQGQSVMNPTCLFDAAQAVRCWYFLNGVLGSTPLAALLACCVMWNLS